MMKNQFDFYWFLMCNWYQFTSMRYKKWKQDTRYTWKRSLMLLAKQQIKSNWMRMEKVKSRTKGAIRAKKIEKIIFHFVVVVVCYLLLDFFVFLFLLSCELCELQNSSCSPLHELLYFYSRSRFHRAPNQQRNKFYLKPNKSDFR